VDFMDGTEERAKYLSIVSLSIDKGRMTRSGKSSRREMHCRSHFCQLTGFTHALKICYCIQMLCKYSRRAGEE
jgi:hypothetical protein